MRLSILLVANVPRCGYEVSEFELQAHNYIHFRTNTLGNGNNPQMLMCHPAKKKKQNKKKKNYKRCNFMRENIVPRSFDRHCKQDVNV